MERPDNMLGGLPTQQYIDHLEDLITELHSLSFRIKWSREEKQVWLRAEQIVNNKIERNERIRRNQNNAG